MGTNQNYQELLNSTMIFVDALKLILQEGQGIVVNKPKDFKYKEDINKLIVFKKDSQLVIIKCDEDLPESTVVALDESQSDEQI